MTGWTGKVRVNASGQSAIRRACGVVAGSLRAPDSGFSCRDAVRGTIP